MICIQGLYETHLTVTDLERSIDFYRDIVGLELAHTIPERNVAFFWIGSRETSMLGLCPSTAARSKSSCTSHSRQRWIRSSPRPPTCAQKGLRLKAGPEQKSMSPSSFRGCPLPASTSTILTATNWNISQSCQNKPGQTFRA